MAASCSVLATIVLASAGVVAQQTDPAIPQVRAYYERASRFEQEGKWPEAEKAWRSALAVAPNDARAWTNLGVALKRQQKESEAVAAWKQALAIDAKLAGPNFNLGLTLVRSGNFAEAISPLRRGLAAEPGHDGGRRALALALIGTDQFQQATRELAPLLARNPQDAGLLELAAQSFARQRRFAEAVVVLERRLRLPKPTANLWAEYGDALDATARTPEALEAYRKAVALDPESTLLRYGLGYLHWKLVQYDDAEREMLEVLRRKPADPRASFTLGDLYLAKGEPARALPFLKTAVAGYPNEFDTRFALGRALVLTGAVKDGVEELRVAVRLDDGIADGHFQLGRALMRLGDSLDGKRELDRARALNEQRRAGEAERHKKKLPSN